MEYVAEKSSDTHRESIPGPLYHPIIIIIIIITIMSYYCLCVRHESMKRIGSIAPFVLNLGTEWSWWGCKQLE
jgi:hypothetical protein